MANRHLARSIVMQTLFEWDFQERNNQLAHVALLRNIAEFAPGLEDPSFLEKLLEFTMAKCLFQFL